MPINKPKHLNERSSIKYIDEQRCVIRHNLTIRDAPPPRRIVDKPTRI